MLVFFQIASKGQILPTTFSEKEYKAFLIGNFEPSEHPLFVYLDKTISQKSGLYLQKVVADSLQKLISAAKKESIEIHVISATRNFKRQKEIWENKWYRADFLKFKTDSLRALSIMRYSSMPGTSRHHWGTDVDFNEVTISYFNSEKGKSVHEWLSKNASKYGFCQVYNEKKGERSGYEEEKWHWSFLPLSAIYQNDYTKLISKEELPMFSGRDCFEKLDVKKYYVNGINKSCKGVATKPLH